MTELSKGYEPALVEDKIYAEWLASGSFTADAKKAFNGHGLTDFEKAALKAKGLKEAFSIVIPPPNVTGILTMGHVLNNTIQDILSRRKRMQGYEVLWLPGTDHAGIATQTVVERHLRKEEKKSRHDLGREEFLKRVWIHKDKHGGIILQQLKKLGCSCDWSRTVFTMDGLDSRHPETRINYSRWVSYVFVNLYEKKLIYRGRRIGNWCVVSNTALSDEEVIMKETRGHLWYIRYPLVEDSTRQLIVATTRPETMLGDTGVAVNPNDERYRHLIGKKLRLPLIGREIPIIADEAVDPKFGTGCVKVTPAHDPADYEMGIRHHLEQIQVIGFNGKMTEKAGEKFEGLDRYECREKVVAELQEFGLIEKIEDYTHNVGYSERADVPVEPLVSDQWYLKYPAVQESLNAVLSRETAFWPDRWTKVYEHWINNLRDWPLSRQLWWGHRIPAWTRNLNGKAETYVGMEPPSGEGWAQDPDVLDTWFSSWLWPFATMVERPEKWVDELKNSQSDISKFYPTNDLVTGPDIIFFWVARMIMGGFEFTGKKPFSNVFFTGIIRDKQGRKMSKSLGNSPDPLDLISKYGADGLRFGIMRCAPLGLDIRFDEQHVELGRNFCNKLWNAARFRLGQKSSQTIVFTELKGTDLSSDDKAVLMQLNQAIEEIDQAYTVYEFQQVTNRLYEFFWSYFCDWYVESIKSVLYGTDEKAKAATLCVMDFVLNNALRLLHPFIPFITEELWTALDFSKPISGTNKGSIQFAPWPEAFNPLEKQRLGLTTQVSEFVGQKHATVTVARNLRASYNIPTNRKTRFIMISKSDWHTNLSEVNSLKTLLNAEPLEIVDVAPKGAASAVSPLGEIFLPLEGLIDVAAEKKRLEMQIGKLQKELDNVSAKLSDTGFTAKAPKEAIDKFQQRSVQLKADMQKIQMQIATLQTPVSAST